MAKSTSFAYACEKGQYDTLGVGKGETFEIEQMQEDADRPAQEKYEKTEEAEHKPHVEPRVVFAAVLE